MTNIPGIPDHAAEFTTELAEMYVPPVKANKAVIGSIIASVSAVVTTVGGALTLAIDDGVISGGEWVTLVVAALGALGITGTATGATVYATTNKPVQ